LQFEQALTRGQLLSVAGKPTDWPEGIKESLRPAEFERALREAFAPDKYAIEDVDCEEFPCVVTLSSVEASDQAGDALQQAIEEFSQSTAGDHAHTVVMARDDNGHVVGGFAIVPDEHWSEAVGTRTRYRTEGQMQGMMEDEP